MHPWNITQTLGFRLEILIWGSSYHSRGLRNQITQQWHSAVITRQTSPLLKSVQHMKPSTHRCTPLLLLFFHYYITHIYLLKKHERKNCEQVNLLDKLFRRPAQFFCHCKRMCFPVRFEPIHLLWNCILSLLILVILVLSTWAFSFFSPHIIK